MYQRTIFDMKLIWEYNRGKKNVQAWHGGGKWLHVLPIPKKGIKSERTQKVPIEYRHMIYIILLSGEQYYYHIFEGKKKNLK